ncbi:FAS1-like dehydratase domain-containing protein [Ideonella livida]|uniref:Acyl-CoA dehydrogenase n=1 Tax=Ideonella livida TaxID=2707176 RepID=A0A7C9TJI1_9BURK|nr:MaoC family dehydratase N-terminal domain-containing protein [Ideonella livida]NDY92040.1 acyl-CoA dehydrogenase [Ideonella livida]
MTATPPLDLPHLQTWIGRTETLADTLTAAPLHALTATLDRTDPPVGPHDSLPPAWHWLYFLPAHRQSEIGPDGHAQRGGFLPPVPLPRRMWAGSRLQFLAPMRVGQALQRVSRITDVQAKDGRTGPLVFVKVRHEVSADGVLAVVDAHDIVYRGLPAPGEAPPAPVAAPGGALDGAAGAETWQRTVVPDDVALFRYSALTFNGHRIHYDRRYVTQVEGYPGLIVHGPLIATLLLDLLRRERPQARVTGFQFKAVSPVFDVAPFTLHGRPLADGRVSLWACTPGGHLAMQAEATLAP